MVVEMKAPRRGPRARRSSWNARVDKITGVSSIASQRSSRDYRLPASHKMTVRGLTPTFTPSPLSAMEAIRKVFETKNNSVRDGNAYDTKIADGLRRQVPLWSLS